MKAIPVLLVAYLFLSCTVEAQDSTSSRWKIGISGSADYCGYLLYIDGVQQERGTMFNTEEAGPGWSAGITSSYDQIPLVSLTGGIRFTEHNIVNGPSNLYDQNGSYVGTFKLTYHTRYIDVPVGMQFHTNPTKRFLFIANGTITPGYALGEWSKLDFTGDDSLGIRDNTSHTDPLNFNYFSLKAEAYVGLGINTGRYQLQILPNVRTSVFMVTKDSYINRRYYTMGLEFRLLYTI